MYKILGHLLCLFIKTPQQGTSNEYLQYRILWRNKKKKKKKIGILFLPRAVDLVYIRLWLDIIFVIIKVAFRPSEVQFIVSVTIVKCVNMLVS